MWHGKIFAQAEIDRVQRAADIGRRQERGRDAVHLVADRVILLAELDQLAQLAFELLGLLAKGEGLALADWDCATAVRMGNRDVGDLLCIVLEKFRMLLEPDCDFFGFHRSPFILRSRLRIPRLPARSSSPARCRPPMIYRGRRRASPP